MINKLKIKLRKLEIENGMISEMGYRNVGNL